MDKGIFKWGRVVLEYFVSLLYPHLCATCGRKLQTTELGICISCAVRLSPYRANRWHAEERLWGSGIFHNLYALYIYEKETPIQEAIHNYKYHSYAAFAKMLAERAAVLYPLRENNYEHIIVVPTSYDHILERGYNQSLIFARYIADLIGKEVSDSYILRYNNTPTQTALNKEERRQNAKGLFYVNPKKKAVLSGARVLVVDDVLTTGSTLLSILDLLEEEGVLWADVLTATVAV